MFFKKRLVLTAEMFHELLCVHKGDCRKIGKYVVTEPVRILHEDTFSIHLGKGRFRETVSLSNSVLIAFDCGQSVFENVFICEDAHVKKSFHCNNAKFIKGFGCNNAIFHDEFCCQNAIFLEYFDCGKAVFEKDFDCGSADFYQGFDFNTAQFHHDFNCAFATFYDVFGSFEKVQFCRELYCTNAQFDVVQFKNNREASLVVYHAVTGGVQMSLNDF